MISDANKRIKPPSPPVRHFHALVPVARAVIGAADLVGADMGKLGFDSVFVPEAAFIQQR